MSERIKNTLFVTILTLVLCYHGSFIVNFDFNGHYTWSDQEGYYMYIPAIFMHHTFENIPVRTKHEYQPYPGTQKILTRFTYGVALMELPFWSVVHVKNYIKKLPIDQPFHRHYSIAILLAGCFYTALGLLYLKKVLEHYFDNKLFVWLTLFIILYGTNLLYYATRQPGMSHLYSFCIISLLMHQMISFFSTPLSKKRIIVVGFLLGLMVLIRPTNLLIAIILLFTGIKNKTDFNERMYWVKNNWANLMLLPLTAFGVWIPQFMYWKYISGSFLFYSYTEAGFAYLKNPYFWQIFLHPCNGFLLYTPVMLLALIGLVYFSWKNQYNSRITLLMFFVFCYLCASWVCWWFGGSFGYRSFIDYYPILALPLAAFLQLIFTRYPSVIRYSVAIFIILCIFVNFRLTTYFHNFQVEPDGKFTEKLF